MIVEGVGVSRTSAALIVIILIQGALSPSGLIWPSGAVSPASTSCCTSFGSRQTPGATPQGSCC